MGDYSKTPPTVMVPGKTFQNLNWLQWAVKIFFKARTTTCHPPPRLWRQAASAHHEPARVCEDQDQP